MGVVVPMAAIACDNCSVRNRALCGALSRDELESLNAIARFRDFSSGENIHAELDVQNYFANVISGVVKLSKSMPDGRQQIVGLQFPSNFLGRPFGEQSPYVAEAATEVRLCTFNKPRFEALTRNFPGLERRLFENTLSELDAARDWMLLLGRKSAVEKVASFLLMVAERLKDTGCHSDTAPNTRTFNLPLTRADMADYLGLTIETVSRQLTKLKSSGLIEIENFRTVVVTDVGRLEKLAGTTSL
jgi:CRP/FNR family transcriptional regulator